MRQRIVLLAISLSLGFLFLAVVLRVSAAAANGRLTVPPVILSLSPQPNSHTAPLTGSIAALYDQPINPATVNSQTFVVHAFQTGLLSELFAVSGGEVSLNPAVPLKPGELVQVIATTGIQNFGGEGPISPTIWQFQAEVTAGSGIFTDSGQSLTHVIEYPFSQVSLWPNQTVPLGQEIHMGLDIGDIDGDGDVDILFGSGKVVKLWLNDGLGNFTDSGQILAHDWVFKLLLGDLDHDGDLDILVLCGGIDSWNWPKVWLNDGAGNFTYLTQTLPLIFGHDGALGDVDGDGALDLVIADYYGDTEVWLNDGNGYFTPTVLLPVPELPVGVDMGDLDKDGDLDIFSVTWFEDQVWLNNGNGTFQNTGQLLGDETGAGVALGDLDGDSDLDAFVIGQGGFLTPTMTHTVWLNNGDGTFQENGQSLVGLSSSVGDVALGDVDADGDLDAFVGTTRMYIPGPLGEFNELWLNDGSGNFTLAIQYLAFDENMEVDFADIDEDGDLDVVRGTYTTTDRCPCDGIAVVKIWLNENIVTPISGLSAESNSPVTLGEAAVMTATIAAGTNVSFSWNFGDGNSGSGPNVTHFYTETGIYTATVTATNSVSAESATIFVIVTEETMKFAAYMPVAIKP